MDSITELKQAVATFGKTVIDELTEIADNLTESEAGNDEDLERLITQVNTLKSRVEQEIKTLVPGA